MARHLKISDHVASVRHERGVQPRESLINSNSIDESKLARSGSEYRALVSSGADWIVRSPDDLRQLHSHGIGPLAKLPEYEFEAFLSGVEFKDGGVAHGTYKPLMSTLTISEIFEVFQRFGMHRDYTIRILEAKCVEPAPGTGGGGDCEFDFWSFCSSMCGIVVVPPESATGPSNY